MNPRAITRRNFLKRSVALAGLAGLGPGIVPAPALGLGGKTPPNERVTVGMIGMGRQAYHVNMKQFLSMPDVQILAVCDVDSWRLDNARKAIEKGLVPKRVLANALRQGLVNREFIDQVAAAVPDIFT